MRFVLLFMAVYFVWSLNKNFDTPIWPFVLLGLLIVVFVETRILRAPRSGDRASEGSYDMLRRSFKARDNVKEYLLIGDHEIYVFNAQEVVACRGLPHRNMACFKDGRLVWVSDFPQGSREPADYSPVTAIGLLSGDPSKIEASDWNGSVYAVDIATGDFEYLRWTK